MLARSYETNLGEEYLMESKEIRLSVADLNVKLR